LVAIVVGVAVLAESPVACGAISFTNPFDRTNGANSYSNLNDLNWQSSFAGLTPHGGSDFLATANGDPSGSFSSAIHKLLGGVIDPQTYEIFFYVAKYEDSSTPLSGQSFGNFTQLRIGGSGGTVVWFDTPTPMVNNVWVAWRGLYTPSPSDVGQQFRFDAAWTLPGRTSLAIDGPMSAIVPEPNALAAAAAMASALLLVTPHTRAQRR
jgi:hypothetical protein